MGLRLSTTRWQTDDGMGSARRLTEHKVKKPIWDRDKFSTPASSPARSRSSPVLALDYVVLDFPTGYVDGLKKQYKAHSGKFCSGFDVLTA
jgi:hypothetical protein